MRASRSAHIKEVKSAARMEAIQNRSKQENTHRALGDRVDSK